MAAPVPTTTPVDQHRDDDDNDEVDDPKTTAQRLSRYIILISKFNGDYLRQVDETLEPHYRNPSLQYTGQNSEKKLDVQFEIEVEQSDKRFVHIRSLRSNRYWEFNLSTKFVTATGEKKVENKKSAICTLFEPIPAADNSSYRLRHVFGNYVSMRSDNLEGGLDGKNTEEDVTGTGVDVHIIVDSESILVLPRYLAFKGSENNKYLKPHNDSSPSGTYLAFSGGKIMDANVVNEIIPGPYGVIRIKNIGTGLYWRSSTIEAGSHFILSDESDTWFRPEKIGDKLIALRYSGSYCKSCTMPDYMHTFSLYWYVSLGGHRDKSTRLEVEEPVVRREISEISFNDFKNYRIYNEKALFIAKGEAVNRSTVDNTFELNIKYSDSKTRTYNHNLSLRLARQTSLEASLVPGIVNGKVEFSAEVCGEKEWGNITGFTETVTESVEVTVPKKSKTKLSVIATQGWCDIPYTYTQRDTLIDGEIKTYEKLQGVYKGANLYRMGWVATNNMQLPPT